MENDNIKKLTAKVFLNGKLKGSAFLISHDTALTARHVVNLGGIIQLSFPRLDIIEPVNVDEVILNEVDCLDIAILKFSSIEQYDVQFPRIYALLPNQINDKSVYKSHGFPVSRINGFLITGKILDVQYSYTQVNLELSADREICYSGASGSPLCIGSGIYGLIIERDTGNELGAITFSECIDFFNKNNISYEQYEPLSQWEQDILNEMEALESIGFDENDELPYIETKAIKCNINDLNEQELSSQHHIQDLTYISDEFFAQKHKNSCNKILYVISDFGKGKSVFLKHEAAKYAAKFKENLTEFLPIYFNLRDYTTYDEFSNNINIRTGCIGEYLRIAHGIDIENTVEKHPIRDKKILLLVDSLDECGSLNESDLKNVMSSVKKFIRFFTDIRVIVTTRPIPNVLESLIKENETYDDKWEFASVYGFMPEQFEQYMYILSGKLAKGSAYSYNKKLIDAIMNNKNIYNEFSEILSEDELKRPIIAYMLFKLLEQDYEIQKDSKLEVFLSFINMLTEEAKHINDKDYGEKDYIQRLAHRNLLYVTAVMWMQNRHNDGNGFLNLGDLKSVAGDKATLIQFLSHSYLRNNNDKYYFNHQSFAEIILAEYYVRVFIWGWKEEKSIQDIMAQLNIGNPTTQTMIFCRGLIKLFIDSVVTSGKNNQVELRRIRKSIFPLIASLGVEKFNVKTSKDNTSDTTFNIYSEAIRDLFGVSNLKGRTDISDESLDNWPISVADFEKIINICIEIINHDENILFFTPKVVETFLGITYKISRRTQEFNIDISRWIAVLILGVFSAYDESIDSHFQDIKPERLVEMMNLSQLESNLACPDWIDVLPELPRHSYNDRDISGLNITNTLLRNWYSISRMRSTSFEHMRIENLQLYKTDFSGAKFYAVEAQSIEIHGYSGNGSEFRGCYFNNFAVRDCTMYGSKIHETIIVDCTFEDVNFCGAELTAIHLIDVTKFQNVNLSGSKISIRTDKNSYEILKKGINNYKWKYIEVLDDIEVERIRKDMSERLEGLNKYSQVKY